MEPRTITGAHRIYVLPKERNKSEYVDYCAQSTTLVEALTKDSLVEHLIISCSDPWGFIFPTQLATQKEREKPLRITLLLAEHVDGQRHNLPRWEELVARMRTENQLRGKVYQNGWQDCFVPRAVYVPHMLMTRIACRDKGKYGNSFPDPTGGFGTEDGLTYRFVTDPALATGTSAEELAQIKAYFGEDLSVQYKPIRKIKKGVLTNTLADMWVYEFLYVRQVIDAHGPSGGMYMNMLYWLNPSEANITDFWGIAEEIEQKADKTDLLSIDERKKLADLSSSFNSLRTADQKKLQGLSLNNFIELSNSSGQVTAYVSGGGSKDAVLMAGITNYGTARQRDKVAIYPNGVGHFGNLYFCGDRIDFKERENDDPKLSILMKEAEFIEKLLRKSRYDHTENSPEEKITLDSNRKQFSFSITVPSDDTRLDIAIGHILCEVYSVTDESQPSRELRVLLDQEILGRWRGSVSYSIMPNPFGGGFTHETSYNPTEVNNLRYTRYVSSGTHTLSIVIYTAQNGADIGNNQALIENVSMRGFYDAGIQQSVISKSGMRIFGDADRYIDVDYRILPSGGGVNPYLLRVKGSARIDYLTLENPLDAPGCVLAGGEVDSSGSVVKSFGKYKKQRGGDSPYTTFNYDTKVYTIYHSIGNTNYIPIVTSRSSAWADLPRVMSVDSNSFTIKFINQENTASNWRQMFIYTCYKAD